jgi:FKBP-type peptidyl-prolyl cis-trans isomerase FklB
MKTGLNALLSISLGAALLPLGCAHSRGTATTSTAATKPAATTAAKPAPVTAAKPAASTPTGPSAPTNLQDRVGYAVGLSIGGNLKRSNFDVNLDEMMSAIKDVLAGRELKMTEQQGMETIRSYQMQRQRELLEKNLKEGEAFLAENRQKAGVQTKEVTLPDGKTAELQYRILTEGTGETPKNSDTVSLNFRGKLLNGQEYDSSYKRGHPSTFVVERVIRGWSEALQMMKVGSKWELYLPASLAYGERGAPSVGPGSTIILETDLLSIDTPKPVTSDIIRVPSAEEMKAGAKIEVIKPEDVEKLTAAESNAVKAAKP